jgi:hypothetical protein
MRRPSSPRYEGPNPAEIRFAGSVSREVQSQVSSYKPFHEQYLPFSRWGTKPRHVEGAEIALIARAAKGCHELVGGLGCINNLIRCGAAVRRTSASGCKRTQIEGKGLTVYLFQTNPSQRLRCRKPDIWKHLSNHRVSDRVATKRGLRPAVRSFLQFTSNSMCPFTSQLSLVKAIDPKFPCPCESAQQSDWRSPG